MATDPIEQLILVVRGQLVMLDADLAGLYHVKTRVLNQAVKRNPDRFPADFLFQLTQEESTTLEHVPGLGGQYRPHCYRPLAFTEHGAGMLAGVLRSPVATRVAIEILRTFARLRSEEEEPAPTPGMRFARSIFCAIRDAVLLLPEDLPYTTDRPYTYFIQAGPGGPIKIGSSRNLPVRLRTLCAMFPVPLKLLGIIEGDVEDRCHFQLGAFRLRGEWFTPSEVVLDFIRQKCVTPAPPQEERAAIVPFKSRG
jgi:hypothetical protein